MSGTDAFIWFVATALAVIGLLALGTYFAVRSYEEAPGFIHVRHRHG